MTNELKSADWRVVQQALNRVGEHLRKPTRLVLIGSSVGMWYSQPGRMTEDIDVWSPRSEVDMADIMQACEKAGVHFDPQGYDAACDGLYLQMVKPGIVNVGKWRDDEHMFTSGNLTVVHPPAENIIASKLMRAEPSDLEDVVFLMARLNVTMDRIQAAVSTLPGLARETAEENMVYLTLHQDILKEVSSMASKEAARSESTRSSSPRPR